MDKIKLILVDDHQMFLDGLISVLGSQDHIEILFVANSAKAALQKMKTNRPDLVITDIAMPEMNGIEFMKIIKDKYPEVKVLGVSMYANLQSYEGIDGYLLKDADKNELLLAIDTIVVKGKKYFDATNNVNHASTFDFKKNILSQREKDIIRLIAQEYTTDEIATKLFLSRGTIETHRKHIFTKLQVKNIAGLVKKAIYLGVLNH